MNTFIFDSYHFDDKSGVASFTYQHANEQAFTEKLFFNPSSIYDKEALQRALFLAFTLIGVSYYKLFPTSRVEFRSGSIDQWQADFLNMTYQEGLSQFAYENGLTRDDLACFTATTNDVQEPVLYDGEGIMALQSGGKDSLLTATLLEQRGITFTSLYISSAQSHPAVLDELAGTLSEVRRQLDRSALQKARTAGGLNGHVPVTYIVLAIALIQAILLGKDTVLASVGHEGEEPHAMIGDLAVNHQWSKTWPAEHRFAEYVGRYISPSMKVGSPLRCLSELRISRLFAEQAWSRFGHSFSSCNVANYTQGADNSSLSWCGHCPKCANAFLLFAPYVAHSELTALFDGQDLFEKTELQNTFKGLLGVDNVMKPFECVGEIDELRHAYHLSDDRGYARLVFAVPASDFDETRTYDAQPWATQLLESTTGTI